MSWLKKRAEMLLVHDLGHDIGEGDVELVEQAMREFAARIFLADRGLHASAMKDPYVARDINTAIDAADEDE